ncbi:uncharacterized protein RHOBADRAFT_55258 [Rhodotorula graminis WP1]|uniref:Uncharacterized protein n=1 Tax=Rhodotorula graminis (strain WP1) TaxID=578459 RepID=A0A0P9EIB6_RHOGW|nr:uncharacterized protein RHOBADRAFT_55258 [Rhodotorula graminis WP1]KPV73016.1 hypothetical protein RHOBADRAFT_55258 [Rhodotorula graminis WP1]
MPPFPAFGGAAQAPRHVIRIPTFQSPTRQRTPAREPQNRDEERQARLGRRGGAGEAQQWASLDQLAQAGPASLAHLLGPRKGAAAAPSAAAVASATSGAGTEAHARRARRSTRGAAGRTGEGEGGAAAQVASTSRSAASVDTASSSAPAAPATAPTRGPRIPRAAVRRPGPPLLGPVVPAAAASSSAPAPVPPVAPAPPPQAKALQQSPPRRLSGTSAAPSLAGKAYRRPSDVARPSTAAAVAPVKEKTAAKRRRVEQVDERNEASSPPPQAKKVKAPAAPSAPAGRRVPRAAGLTAKSPAVEVAAAPIPHEAAVKPSTAGKKRAAVEPAPLARKAPAPPAALPPATRKEKKRAREATPAAASEDEDEDEAVQLALVGAPSPKARKRAAVRDDEDEGDVTLSIQFKPAKRPRARPAAPALSSPPLPSPPRPPVRSKTSSRAVAPPSPASAPARASSSPPPQLRQLVKKKVASTAKHVVVSTVRKRGNSGALNALDVVVGASATTFERLLDETDGRRSKKALKLLRKRVEEPLMNCTSAFMHAYTLLSSSVRSILGYLEPCSAAECSGGASSRAARSHDDVDRAPKFNHLGRLPAELLFLIGELVDEAGGGPYLARVSRMLVPIARHLAFRKVTVVKPEHVRRLCDIVKSSSAVAESVVELHIDLAACDTQNLPSRPTWLALLRALVHLERLDVLDAPSLIDLVLSSPNLNSVLPDLRSLDLALRPVGSSSTNVERGARVLENDDVIYDKLGVSVPAPVGRIASLPAPANPPPLRRISLTLPLHADSLAVSFLRTLEHVREVAVHDTTLPPSSPINTILGHLPNPDLVTSLSLSQLADADQAHLADALEPFTALETLELGGGTLHVATRAAIERSERLVELRLARGLDIELDELREVVCAPGALERIVLDAVPLDCGVEHEHEREPGQAHRSATDDLLDLVPLAAAHGVTLDGAAIELARDVRTRRTRSAERARRAAVPVEEVGVSAYFSSRQCSWP